MRPIHVLRRREGWRVLMKSEEREREHKNTEFKKTQREGWPGKGNERVSGCWWLSE